MLTAIKPAQRSWSGFKFDVSADERRVLALAMSTLPSLEVIPFACARRELGGTHFSFLCHTRTRQLPGPDCVKKIQVFSPENGAPYLTHFTDIQP